MRAEWLSTRWWCTDSRPFLLPKILNTLKSWAVPSIMTFARQGHESHQDFISFAECKTMLHRAYAYARGWQPVPQHCDLQNKTPRHRLEKRRWYSADRQLARFSILAQYRFVSSEHSSFLSLLAYENIFLKDMQRGAGWSVWLFSNKKYKSTVMSFDM